MLIRIWWDQYAIHRMQRMAQNNVDWEMTEIDKLEN